MSITQAFSSSNEYQMIVERDEALAELNRAREGVTVCVTYHNEPQQILDRAVGSVVGQTLPVYECLIIDDGSDYPWAGRVAEPDDSRFRSVRITNRGLPAARNTGLMLCKTEAILFLDADDWLDPTYIEKTLPLLKHADVVLTGLQEHGPTRNGTYMPGYDRPHTEVTWELLMDDYNRFFYCALWRRSALAEMGGYHPAMAGWPGVSGGFEDWTTWVDALRRGLRFEAVYEPLFNYNTANGPTSMLAKAEQNRAALVAEMRRHHRLV